MNFGEKVKRSVQSSGARFSLMFFSNKSLERDWVKDAYLFMYGAFKKIFEGSEFKKIKKYIQPGSIVLDIGANVGFAARIFSEAAENVKVFSFEPDPVAGKIFEHNIKKSNRKNIRLVKTALGDRMGVLEFAENLSNRADNRVNLDAATMLNVKTVLVPVTTLSFWIEKNRISNVSFIKIDVQGYELGVLRGAEKWLKKLESKPVICLEVWPYGLIQAGTSELELYSFMNNLGYVPFGGKNIITEERGYDDQIFVPLGYAGS